MELYLQFGYGMMDHCRSLVREWKGGSVILSPRDLTDKQLNKFARDLRALGATVLLDPQFYLPHSDHHRLCSHAYWPDDYESMGFWSGRDLNTLLSNLRVLNTDLGCDNFILPGLHADVIDEDWLSRQQAVVEEAVRMGISSDDLLATVALGGDAVKNMEQIYDLLEASRGWSVGGIYLICEHPKGDYLVDEPIWLANVLDLIAGFRLQGHRVIVGYCNHQMLIAACAAATAIASGTWTNVRSFLPDKFRSQYEEEVKQRTVWYYCPQALSEFKIPFLDIAHRQGVLAEMAPPDPLRNAYADTLFRGVQPTTVGFTEQWAFRHYLLCLRTQVITSRRETFQETFNYHQDLLDQAENILDRLHAVGVRGQQRDFHRVLDTNRAALIDLANNRGPMLRRYWNKM